MLSLCDRLGVPEVADVRATSLATLALMAASGLGLTVLPAIALEAGAAGARLEAVPFAGPPPHRTIALAFRRTTARRDELTEIAKVLRHRRPEGSIGLP